MVERVGRSTRGREGSCRRRRRRDDEQQRAWAGEPTRNTWRAPASVRVAARRHHTAATIDVHRPAPAYRLSLSTPSLTVTVTITPAHTSSQMTTLLWNAAHLPSCHPPT